MSLELTDVARLLAATVAGALIGFERELHDKPAGFRTNILICLGAAAFTVLSTRISAAAGVGDPARISAQIVSGVGFLGAGAIIQSRGQVHGLTTAATIWAVASVGMAFGSGFFLIGAAATVLIVCVLFGLAKVEPALARWHTTASFEIELAPSSEVADRVDKLVSASGLLCEEWRVFRGKEAHLAKLVVTGAVAKIEQLEDALARDDGVHDVKRR